MWNYSWSSTWNSLRISNVSSFLTSFLYKTRERLCRNAISVDDPLCDLFWSTSHSLSSILLPNVEFYVHNSLQLSSVRMRTLVKLQVRFTARQWIATVNEMIYTSYCQRKNYSRLIKYNTSNCAHSRALNNFRIKRRHKSHARFRLPLAVR